MFLAQLIDPSRIFTRPLGFTAIEHSGWLLSIWNNYINRQAEIFRQGKDNSVELETPQYSVIRLFGYVIHLSETV